MIRISTLCSNIRIQVNLILPIPLGIPNIEEEKELPEESRTCFNESKVVLPSYEKYKAKWEKNRSSMQALNCKKLWTDWLKLEEKIDPEFIFLSRKLPYRESEIGLFANTPSFVYILHQYKKEFSNRTRLEYQSAKEVLQIKNVDSIFWNKVFQDHFLTGLVYGYGEKSSYLI